MPLTVASIKMKYLEINLTKEVKDLYNENKNESWKDETQGNLRKWNRILFCIGQINAVKTVRLLKCFCRCGGIPANPAAAFLTELQPRS